jgi:hypothetical protein
VALRPGTVVKVSKLPTCDFCREAGIDRPARYDFHTKLGPWANGCIEHYEQHRAYPRLGTGYGQFLIVLSERVEMGEDGRLAWKETLDG